MGFLYLTLTLICPNLGRIKVSAFVCRKHFALEAKEVPMSVPKVICISELDIDQEAHMIHLRINDCPVTMLCAAQPNPTAYEQVKSILINAILDKTP